MAVVRDMWEIKNYKCMETVAKNRCPRLAGTFSNVRSELYLVQCIGRSCSFKKKEENNLSAFC